MSGSARERAEALLDALPALSRAVGSGKSTELPLRGGARPDAPLSARPSASGGCLGTAAAADAIPLST
jgi:hypothetical protein